MVLFLGDRQLCRGKGNTGYNLFLNGSTKSNTTKVAKY
jgi:hypothetical protein